MRLPRLLPLALLLLSACAEADASAPGGGAPTSEPTQPPKEPRYEANAMVLERPTHGVILCVGVVTSSLPPAGCGGVPITNWDWEQVTGEESVGGTTWGEYHVVGTFDGTSFTVTEIGPPEPQEPPEVDASSPCPEPEGGWPIPDPDRASIGHVDPAARLAESKPDFAALWVTPLDPMDRQVVLNVAFTGNLAEHEAELRDVWGGPLCVTRHERTLRELEQIRDELLEGGAAETGLQVLTISPDQEKNTVRMQVVWADAAARAEIDRRYGKGTVEIENALTPVDD